MTRKTINISSRQETSVLLCAATEKSPHPEPLAQRARTDARATRIGSTHSKVRRRSRWPCCFARKKNGQSLNSKATLSQASSPISTVPPTGRTQRDPINNKQKNKNETKVIRRK